MFNPTHYLRMSNTSRNITFRGFTKARFKSLYIDPQQAINAQDKVYSYNAQMNNNLIDISLPEVQNALINAMIYAQDAAKEAAEYFAKRPSTFHPRRSMGKVFTQHFKNASPSTEDRDTVQATFRRTAAGLAGNIVVSDLFTAADRFNKGGLVWGAEGQVAFDPETDDAFMSELMEEGGIERKNDIMRQYLSTADTLEIYIDFGLLRTFNIKQMARVIVHEATHKFAYTGDYAYFSNSGDVSGMMASEALKNADSYAYAAISIKAGNTLTHDKIARLGSAMVARG